MTAEPTLDLTEEWPQADGGTLRFNPDGHIYTYAGPGESLFRQVPSITTILRPMNDEHYGVGTSGARFAANQHAAERGHAVHEACWYLDQDDLDEDSLDAEVKPYVAAYRKFREESGVEIIEIETPRAGKHGSLVFAGRPDRIVTMPFRGKRRTPPSPLDIKTTVDMAPAVGRQVAGYAELMDAPKFSTPLRGLFTRSLYALQLKPDGTYRLWDYKADHYSLRNHFHALLVHHVEMEKYR